MSTIQCHFDSGKRIFENLGLVGLVTMKNDFQKKTKQLICMLLVNGYALTRYHSITSNTCVLLIKKHDILGAPVKYGVILSTASLDAAERDGHLVCKNPKTPYIKYWYHPLCQYK